ncbi:lipopolysaccharide biosynthesis protein [Psychromarinibacter sediminicola]|uniref:lipopolysaccharide biosynthesis protein n=1 Tax=Psychromarinibacter sediminicola TaxID=3033385 RepID=UPI0023BAB949|nr:polysaccharide biosynthesis C-terminal domain-containing protein [Psychromarinibacter sediminicola]
MTLITLITIPVQKGCVNLIIRELSRVEKQNYIRTYGSLIVWLSVNIISISTISGVVIFLLYKTGVLTIDISGLRVLGVAWVISFSTSVCAVISAILRSSGRVHLGQLPEFFFRQFIFLLAIFVLLFFVGYKLKYLSSVLQVYALSGLAAVLCSFVVLLISSLHRRIHFRQIDMQLWGAWYGSMFSLSLVGGMVVLQSNVDIIMISQLASFEDVAVYKLSISIVALTQFGHNAVLSARSQRFASLYFSENLAGLEREAISASRFATGFGFISFFVVLILLLAYSSIFSLYEYEGILVPFLILFAGQLLSLLLGPCSIILNMTGHEKRNLIASLFGIVSNVIGNYILVPALGVIGAALATAFSILVWKFVTYRMLRSAIGIDTMAFRNI